MPSSSPASHIWSPVLGEELSYTRESYNHSGPNAVAVHYVNIILPVSPSLYFTFASKPVDDFKQTIGL